MALPALGARPVILVASWKQMESAVVHTVHSPDFCHHDAGLVARPVCPGGQSDAIRDARFFFASGIRRTAHYREKKQIRTAFSGYVSPQVLKEILSGKIKPGLGGERVHAAVLFSDIRNFTTRSESLTPERTIELLNSYFSEMTEAVQTTAA